MEAIKIRTKYMQSWRREVKMSEKVNSEQIILLTQWNQNAAMVNIEMDVIIK